MEHFNKIINDFICSDRVLKFETKFKILKGLFIFIIVGNTCGIISLILLLARLMR